MSILDKKAKSLKKYNIHVDKDKLTFHKPVVTGREILVESGKNSPECFALYQKLKGCDFEKVGLDESVDLSHPGIEKFIIKDSEVRNYTLDDEPEMTDKKALSANEILELGGLTPVADYYLIEIDNAGNETNHKDTPDDPIQMRCPGSKFVSVFRGETPVSNC